MTPDLINGCFELAAGLLIMLNVRKLYRDKQLRGVCIAPTALMATWGFWNLYFYPHVGALWSFAAGIPIAVINTIWVGQMILYTQRERKTKKINDAYCATIHEWRASLDGGYDS